MMSDSGTASTSRVAGESQIRVFCVDDNQFVIDALRTVLDLQPDIAFDGCAENADQIFDAIGKNAHRPHVVLLDIDMPGRSAFDALAELARQYPDTRVLMYSGLVNRDLVDQAIDAGAWGFVAKVDGERELIAAIRGVMSGSFAFTSTIHNMMRQQPQ